MDFTWAIKQMKEGRKVRRPMWDTDYYYKFDFDTIDNETYIIDNNKITNISLSEMEATDWELYNKQFNLSKKMFISTIVTDTYNLTTRCYTEGDIKEFINKLKEEIKRAEIEYREIYDVPEIIDKLVGERFK